MLAGHLISKEQIALAIQSTLIIIILEDIVSEVVCMSGASTATNKVKCGTLSSKNYSYSVNDTVFTKLRSATYESIPGDSCGTVYGGTTLKGINKGHVGKLGIYSHVDLAVKAIKYKYQTDFYIIF